MASAIAGVRAAEKAKAAKARALRESKLDAIFSKFDTDQNGNLDRRELEMLLRIVSTSDSNCSQKRWPSLCQSWGDVAENHVVTPEELDMVETMAGGGVGKMVTRETLSIALDAFEKYRAQAPTVALYFKKYDATQSGRLEREELKHLLTDLNDGIPPTDKELDFVLSAADKQDGKKDNAIKPPELPYAISLWVQMTKQKLQRESK